RAAATSRLAAQFRSQWSGKVLPGVAFTRRVQDCAETKARSASPVLQVNSRALAEDKGPTRRTDPTALAIPTKRRRGPVSVIGSPKNRELPSVERQLA